ncbi:MAG: phage integrase family protein [Lachnospiraceae bacterium]|nr:phage integrase family protein [Lachnospiraceae bacterium]
MKHNIGDLADDKCTKMAVPSSNLDNNLINDCTNLLRNATLDAESQALLIAMNKKLKEKYARQVCVNGNIWEQPSKGLWLAKVRKDGKKKQISAATKDKLIDKLYAMYQEEHTYTMGNLFREMLAYKMGRRKKPLSEKTASEYLIDWKKYYSEFENRGITDISAEEWHDFFMNIVNENEMSKKQFYNMRTVANSIMSYAISRKIIPYNPIRDINTFDFDFVEESYNQVKSKPFTQEQSAKVFEWCQQQLEKDNINKIYPLALMFQLIMGLRVGEVRGIEWSDVDFEHKKVYICQQTVNGISFDADTLTVGYSGENHLKHLKANENARQLMMSDEIIQVLKQVKALDLPGEKVFPLRYNTYNSKVKEAAKYAGADPKDFHTHCLRATRLTDLYYACGDERVVQALAGHTTPEMTHKYIDGLQSKQRLDQIMSQNIYSTPTQPLKQEK